MKKLVEKIRKWHNDACINLKRKYQSKGITYLRLVQDYFDLSILFVASFVINIILIVLLIIFICL